MFAQLIPRLQWSVSEMAVTVEDIAAQLPSRDIAESQRADITKFCKGFRGRNDGGARRNPHSRRQARYASR